MFPHLGNNVGAMRRQCTIEHLQTKFGGTMSKHGIFCNIGAPVRSIRFCSEICNVGGRILSAPTQTVPLNYCRGDFVAFVGAAIRPVVSPLGKQRRRNAPTMHHRTFANEIRRYNVETWYILQHRSPGTINSVLLRNLQRWRADTIRPYADGATELLPG